MVSVGGSLSATSDLRSPTVFVAVALVADPNRPDMMRVSLRQRSSAIFQNVSLLADVTGVANAEAERKGSLPGC